MSLDIVIVVFKGNEKKLASFQEKKYGLEGNFLDDEKDGIGAGNIIQKFFEKWDDMGFRPMLD